MYFSLDELNTTSMDVLQYKLLGTTTITTIKNIKVWR